MKRNAFFWVILIAFVTTHRTILAQESINLNYLYGQWVVPPEFTDVDFLELHPYRIGFKKREKDGVITFKKADDNIIHCSSSSNIVCGPSSGSFFGSEKWVVIPDSTRLENQFLDEKNVKIYSITYEIVDVNREVLKLKRISEYFNEDWD